MLLRRCSTDSSHLPRACSASPRPLRRSASDGTRARAPCRRSPARASIVRDKTAVCRQCRVPARALPGRARGPARRPCAPGPPSSASARRWHRAASSPPTAPPRLHEAGVERHRLFVVADRRPKRLRCAATLPGGLAFEVRVVRREIPRRPGRQDLLLPRADRHVERLATWPAMSACTSNTSVSAASNGCCHLAAAVRHLDELRAHLHPARAPRRPSPAHLAHEQVVHPQLPPDLLRRLAGAAVLGRAVGGGHQHRRQRRELAAHRVGDAVREVGVRRVAEVLEREYGDPSLVARRRGLGMAVRRQAKSTPTPIRSPSSRARARDGRRLRRSAVVRYRGTVALAGRRRRRRERRSSTPYRRAAGPPPPFRRTAFSACARTAPSSRTGPPPPATAPSGSPGPRSPAGWRAPTARSAPAR